MKEDKDKDNKQKNIRLENFSIPSMGNIPPVPKKQNGEGEENEKNKQS